jgi:hypothetical protein
MFKCKLCGKEFANFNSFVQHFKREHKIDYKKYFDTYIEPNDNHLCPICKLRQRKFFKGKYRKTCCTKECRDKCIVKTCIENNGVPNNFLVKDKNGKPKRNKTMLNHYGYEYNLQRPEILKIYQEGFEKKWGSKTPFESKKWHKLYNPMKTKEGRLKNKNSYFKNRKKHVKRFKFENEYFDSSWELAYYIWLKDHNIEFTHEPFKLKYIFKEETFCYLPDFKIGDDIVEIKGLHFFENHNPNGKMINPYDRTEDDKYEAKHQCMIENNVKIITDCSVYIEYIETMYGKNYLETFRRKR